MSRTRIFDLATMASIVAIAFARLLPHWPNFTPVLAVALCGGMIYTDRRSFVVPLLAMVLSDLVMGLTLGAEYALHTAQVYVYACVIGTSMLGRYLGPQRQLTSVLAGGLVSGIGFFLVTNGAVWLHGTMYPHTVEGLLACYGAGLAFYRDAGNFLFNGIVSTWLYAAAILAFRATLARRFTAVA
jgi:hypothetical protein